MSDGKQRKRHIRWQMVALAVFFIAFCVSGTMVVTQIVRQHREDNAFEALSRRVREPQTPEKNQVPNRPNEPAATPDDRDDSDGSDDRNDRGDSAEAEFTVYDDLAAENPDIFGWVRIDGTKIDYPVMHTPEDPEHYLHRAFDGSNSSSGVPFLDGDCVPGCGNYIVYGHHMKNGTMFAGLSDYADEDFWREHPVIQFDTLDEPGEYEVLAAFYAKAYYEDETGGFRFYEYTDLTDEETFAEYLRNVQEAALYDTGVDAQYGDGLLTLTTCSYHVSNGRFVVVARKSAGE